MMKKILLNLVLVITIFSASDEIVAQSDIALATRKAKLQALSEKLKNRDETNQLRVYELAQRMGIPIRRELPNGKVLELQRVSQDAGPIFYITNNAWAADTVSTLQVWPQGSAELNLKGGGMTIGEWDAGAIFEHPDFNGRLTQIDTPPSISNHSTHVAGTLIATGEMLDPNLGAGEIPRARGMAYAAHLNAYDWNFDTFEMTSAATGGLLISNHSYGVAAGWLYIGGLPPDNWWWIGGDQPSNVEDPNFGYYDAESQLWDDIAFNAPYYLIVKAAGNDRSDSGPSVGEEYTIIDQEGTFLSTSTLPRNSDCAPAGYDCLPTNSVAKNVLTVGAVNDLPGGYTTYSGSSQVQMTPFSGWGPTDDGRIKPDVVGNGEFLVSTWHDSPFYAAVAGTSMAAPNVAGSLLLLQEHYQNIHGSSNFMRSATLKALAIHTADEAGSYDGPDYAFGWGLLNTKNAAKVISEDGGGDHQIIEGSLTNGTVDTIEINITEANTLITTTLVWTDPAGTPTPFSLDAPDIMLVNDLDLRITRAPSSFRPWVLSPEDPAAAATKGDNFRDNVEQVVAVGSRTGTYRIEISHKGNLRMLDGASQDYSLIISVSPSPTTGESSLLIDEDFSAGLPAGWSVETISGTNWTINTPVQGDYRLENGTGGTGQFAMVDNNYCCQTVTAMRMPTFDLSSSESVILRFNSYFFFELYESINVDISTDEGTNWINTWTLVGINHATQHVLDLSAVTAGQASVMIRFLFDSEGDTLGNLWQIDDVQLEVFGVMPPPSNTPPTASFTFTSNNLTADFTNSSTDPDGTVVAWNWTFGDGGSSTAQHPSHSYSVAGTYPVMLMVTDNDGMTNSTNQPLEVTIPPVSSAPNALFTYSCTGKECNFDASGSTDDNMIVTYDWSFGDNSIGNNSPVLHTYSSIGDKNITLTVTDNDSNTGTISGIISIKKGKKTSSGSIGVVDSGGVTGDSEKGKKKCTDEIDNDGDGLIDGADPDC